MENPPVISNPNLVVGYQTFYSPIQENRKRHKNIKACLLILMFAFLIAGFVLIFFYNWPRKHPSITDSFSIKEIGQQGSFDYRVYFLKNSHVISPVHDIPLWIDRDAGIVNMYYEVPNSTHAKFEVDVEAFLNPIKQDVRNGQLRYINMSFPFNYGSLPQTYEDPYYKDPSTKIGGDSDPLDSCDISINTVKTGDIRKVKVLGAWAMISNKNETDWKILTIDITDPLAVSLNDIQDVKRLIPEKIETIFTFLRDYDEAGQNKFALHGELQGKDVAMSVVEDYHRKWISLMFGHQNTTWSRANVTPTIPNFVDNEEIEQNLGWCCD
eukprot:TRINITY_DN5556_c0_g1_i1.p1 TRINITY_DN5556_c0_g1~~TRINITY_DN5556_c0_g1_i1.p1  ORF type:complete len:325 (-),score=47.68 TRINITY_DN5556_c0_g1_i1:80-1054(-)